MFRKKGAAALLFVPIEQAEGEAFQAYWRAGPR